MTEVIDRTRASELPSKTKREALPRLRNQNFELEKNWLNRPIRVFHVREGRQADDRNFVASGSDTDEEMALLLRDLEVLGYLPMDVICIEQDAKIADFAWPRNMEWSSLPQVSNPSFKNYYGHFIALDEFGHPHRIWPKEYDSGATGEIVSDTTKILVISARDLNDEVLASFARLTEGFTNLVIMHYDGSSLRPVEGRALSSALEAFNADARFVYNHAVNMVVITSRVFLKIARDAGASQAYVEALSPKLRRLRGSCADNSGGTGFPCLHRG